MVNLYFGPPGIGKSTYIKNLLAEDNTLNVFDLEDAEQSTRMSRLETMAVDKDLWFVGAADIDPTVMLENVSKYLLTVSSQSEYEARRATRDTAEPDKSNQSSHQISDWVRMTDWDDVIDISDESYTESVVDSSFKYPLLSAYREEDDIDCKGSTRFVFATSYDDKFIVVEFFGESPDLYTLYTVKILGDKSGIDKSISYWETQTLFEPSDAMIVAAQDAIRTTIEWLTLDS